MTTEDLPAWRRSTEGEPRWAAAAGIVVMAALQLSFPEELAIGTRWLLPAVEGVLLGVLLAANPTRLGHITPVLRATSLVLLGVAAAANAFSAVALVVGLVRGTFDGTAAHLLLVGASVYLTNVVVFALAYWELDRGGPAARAQGVKDFPDFLFPQMGDGSFSPADWEPTYADYLYVSFTNATAFSPTDTMPLSRWAKLAMMAQSGVALATVAMVVARAVNILPS